MCPGLHKPLSIGLYPNLALTRFAPTSDPARGWTLRPTPGVTAETEGSPGVNGGMIRPMEPVQWVTLIGSVPIGIVSGYAVVARQWVLGLFALGYGLAMLGMLTEYIFRPLPTDRTIWWLGWVPALGVAVVSGFLTYWLRRRAGKRTWPGRKVDDLEVGVVAHNYDDDDDDDGGDDE
jgi:hypothetical protein